MPSLDSAIPADIVREHDARLGAALREQGYSAAIIFHRSNMLGFLGTPASASDRFVCGVVTAEGEAYIICPAFEKAPISRGTTIPAAYYTWEEHEDAYACLPRLFAECKIPKGKVAVDGRTWIDAIAAMRAALDGYELLPGETILREIRAIKSAAELQLVREAHLRGEKVFLEVQRRIRPGVTEAEFWREINEYFGDQGMHVGPLVQTGVNASMPHHGPDDTKLEEGHAIVFDSVTSTKGYNNDLTRTYALGDPGPKVKKAYKAVRDAQAAAIAAAKPGVTCGELDAIARNVITDAGFGEYFLHRLGHGMGLECHEWPFLVGGSEVPLRPGMFFTVEPGVYVPGEFGVRIEDDIIITEDGCELVKGELPTDVSEAFRC